MYNSHLIRVYATSHEEAEQLVYYMEDFENSEITICGSMREDGQTHNTGAGSWRVEEETLDSVNSLVQSWAKEDPNDAEHFKILIKAYLFEEPILNNVLWSYGESFCNYKSALGGRDPNNLDPWTDIYRDWQMDREGITDLNLNMEVEIEGKYKYLVFIDVHS